MTYPDRVWGFDEPDVPEPYCDKAREHEGRWGAGSGSIDGNPKVNLIIQDLGYTDSVTYGFAAMPTTTTSTLQFPRLRATARLYPGSSTITTGSMVELEWSASEGYRVTSFLPRHQQADTHLYGWALEAPPPAEGVWAYYEFHIEPTGVTARINGGQVGRLDYARPLTYVREWTTIQMGVTLSYANYLRIDDVYVKDGHREPAFLGDLRVMTLYPTGPGESSEWAGSDGDSVDNHLLVDESPPDTSDYLVAAESGLTDLYQFTDIPEGWQVLGVSMNAYQKKTDAGASPWVGVVARFNDQVLLGDALPPPGTSYTAAGSSIIPQAPDGIWTRAKVNATQFGIRSIEPDQVG